MNTSPSENTISPGDRVYQIADPRHVGIVMKIYSTNVARVVWLDTKWVSYLKLRELSKQENRR
jgi:hypothetical protein